MINWKVRLKNKSFWITLIPTVLLLAQVVARAFGAEFDFDKLGDTLLSIVNSIFALLAVLGIVTDPTTVGIGDSERALTYETPYAASTVVEDDIDDDDDDVDDINDEDEEEDDEV